MEQSSDHSEATGQRQSSGHSSILSANLDQKVESSAWGIPSKSNAYHGSSDASLFSSSLPVLPHEKLNFTDSKPRVQSTDDASSKLNKDGSDMEGKDSLDDLDLHCIGSLLPDDEEELLAGIKDDFDLSGLPSQVEELEEYDLFGSGGGMELDSDPIQTLNIAMSNARFSEGYTGTGIVHYNVPNNVAALVGEHPYGEHPSRTLFVRNINSNVEDSELLSLFEQYGDIRTLYTACKHRGFVMVSYYDIRDARTAMNALQNKPLRRRKLDIHFSIPKDNPSDKDMNQGTLVAFNLDPSVSNDDLLQIFGVYGEVKEIRETPHKRHHKFIEFYDVRAAEAALQSLNRSDIAGKRIKLEPSRPGGARRNLMQQLSQDEQDETRICRHPMGSPITSSPTALMGSWAHFSTSGDNGPQEALSKSPTFGAMSPMGHNNHLPGLASVLTPLVRSNSVKIAPIGKDRNRIIPDDQVSPHGVPIQHPHSFPEHSSGMMMSGPTTSKTPGIATLNGPQFLWGSPTLNSESSQSSAWQSPSTGHSFTSNGHVGNGIVYSNHNGSFIASPHQQCHHVGSAPPGDPFERHFGYRPESPETPFMSQATFGSMGISRKEGSLMSLGSRAPMNPGLPLPGSMFENGIPSFRMLHPHSFGPTFVGSAPYPVPRSFGIDGLLERNHSRRIDNGGQIDNKKQYQLDLEKVVIGEDTRTTLMIKNIPNKYTSKMLLAAIDENHKCTYDFLYLPIDFKNKCNVGYAFINMVSPSHIISFYQAFNGKRWEKFNSEKVASLAYARIQGKTALIAHFQNSSLMNEDKRCRPIIFHSGGPEVGDQGNGLNIFCVRKQDSPESPTEECS